MIVASRKYGILICISALLSCAKGPSSNITNYFKDLPIIESKAFSPAIFETFNYDSVGLIDSSIVAVLYPDSILKDIELDQFVCYPYGKYTETDSWFSVIVLREHGEWLKTLELLSFNEELELQSLIILSGIGGDIGYSYEGSGGFIDNSSYTLTSISRTYGVDLLSEEESRLSCDSTIIITKLDHSGRAHVTSESFNCHILSQ